MTQEFATHFVFFILGGFGGILLCATMNFDYKSLFEYLLKREEMRMQYTKELLEKENEHDGE